MTPGKTIFMNFSSALFSFDRNLLRCVVSLIIKCEVAMFFPQLCLCLNICHDFYSEGLDEWQTCNCGTSQTGTYVFL